MDYQQSITCTIQTGKEIIAATSRTKNALSRCNAQIIPQNKRAIMGVAYSDSKPSDRIIASQLASFRQLIEAIKGYTSIVRAIRVKLIHARTPKRS